MRIIEAKAHILPAVNTSDITQVLARIELCGRVCYKSEDKITEKSAARFVQNLIQRGHESVLEHVDYIVRCSLDEYCDFEYACDLLRDTGENVLIRQTADGKLGRFILSGNIRMWRDFLRLYPLTGSPSYPKVLQLFTGLLFDDVRSEILDQETGGEVDIIQKTDLLPGKEMLTHYTDTALFITDRGVSHEIVRHRQASYSQESTRYCNYSKGRFGSELTFIRPCFWPHDNLPYHLWRSAMSTAEGVYKYMMESGATPEQARSVLPSSLKTEVVMTANLREWRHFFQLRCAKAAHPQMREIALQLLTQSYAVLPVIFEDVVNKFAKDLDEES